MRYVRLEEIPFYLPQIFEESLDDKQLNDFMAASDHLLEEMEAFIERWTDKFELDKPGQNFEWKKKITSALRYWAPEGLATSIGWTVNVRELRFVIERRTHPSAEEAMRTVFGKVAAYVTREWPLLFGDFRQHPDGSWSTA
jgi:thymidylate synthase (FAD)